MRLLLRAAIVVLVAAVALPTLVGVSSGAEQAIPAYFDDSGIVIRDAPSSTAVILTRSITDESATVYCSTPDAGTPGFLYYKVTVRGINGWVFSRAIRLRDPNQAVPPCAPQTGTSLNISVTSTMERLVSDPARFAYVRLTVTVKNPDGTPARFANIRVSTSNRRTFQTDRSGVWSNTVPVVLPPLKSPDDDTPTFINVTATSTSGQIGSRTGFLLYRTLREVTCSFPGLPSSRGDFLSSFLPSPFDVIYDAALLLPAAAGLHTDLASYSVVAGTSGQTYARELRVTGRRGNVALDAVMYSARQIQTPPQSEYEAIVTSCRGLQTGPGGPIA